VRPLAFVALALLLVALQSALLRWVGGGALPLALPLAVVVYLGLHAANVEGAVASAMIGWVVDVSAGGTKGLLTCLAVALFLLARAAASAVELRGRISFAVLTTVGTFIVGALALGLIHLVAPPEASPAPSLLGRVALEAFLTGVAAVPLLGFLRRVDGLFAREDPTLLR
jgi:rod shape-determining protein MreD